MNLLAAIKPVQDQLDVLMAKISDRENKVSDRELVVLDRESKVSDRETAVSEQEVSLQEREQIVLNAEAEQARIEELKSLIQQKASILIQLGQTQRDQVDIMANIKQRQEDLAKREKALSDEKETYKETLKTEFFAEVAKGLPK